MLEEARRALHPIRCAATQPAGEEGVRRVVGRRLVTYPQAKMNEGQWAAWWQDFYDACADMAEEALEAGMAAHVRDPASQFMPKPGRLRELAQSTPNRAATAYHRITAAIWMADAPPMTSIEPKPPAGPRPTKAEIDGMLAGYRANVAERRAADQARYKAPPTHGKVDETGITAHLRARMEQLRQDA